MRDGSCRGIGFAVLARWKTCRPQPRRLRHTVWGLHNRTRVAPRVKDLEIGVEGY